MEMLGVGIDLMAIVLTFVVLVGVLLGRKNAMNEYFPTLLLMNALTILADLGTYAFAGDMKHMVLLRLSCILQFAFAYCGVAGFNLYIDKLIRRISGKKPMMRVIPFVLTAMLTVLWMTSLATGWFFEISDEGVYSFGPYFIWIILGGVLIAGFDLIRILVNHTNGKIENDIAIGMYVFFAVPLLVLPVACMLPCMSLFFGAVSVSYLIMYIMIHVRMEHATITKEMEDRKIQIELIMSQIQPHFVFNSLTTIRYLCRNDVPLAIEALGKFTKYLRQNLDSIASENLVPFSEELEHTKTYLWLEKLRFGKDLRVEYSIDSQSFKVPPLSLQPIVENAVKHGVTKKVGGGTVSISVREYDKFYKIVVEDDGVGFAPKSVQETEGQYTGIQDIRKRLKDLNGSRLKINSQEGIGTTVTYEIVKGD